MGSSELLLAVLGPDHFLTGAAEEKVLFLGYFPESVCFELVSLHRFEAANRRRCFQIISGDQVHPGEPQRPRRHVFFTPPTLFFLLATLSCLNVIQRERSLAGTRRQLFPLSS